MFAMKTFSLGRFFGVNIKIDITFILLFVVFVLTSLPFGAQRTLEAILAFNILAFSIVAHEYGHIFSARKFKCECKEMILSFFGGAAMLSGNRLTNKQTMIMAFAGPLVSLFLCLISIPVLFIFIFFSLNNDFMFPFKAMCGLNLMLFVFNMIPIFPMDGGRIFRAFLGHIGKTNKQTIKISIVVNVFFITLLLIACILLKMPFTLIVVVMLAVMTYGEWKGLKK